MSRRDGASRTARKVALNVLSLGSKPGMEDILPPGIVEATARLLVAADVVGEGAVRFARTRTAVAIYEAFDWMLPGQFEAFASRKAFCEHQAREGIDVGAAQVLVLGAGYDTLGWRLAPEFPGVRFYEIDHPATAGRKARGIDTMGPRSNLHLLQADLGGRRLEDVLAGVGSWDRTAHSVVIAEGLTPYLAPAAVRDLFVQCGAVTGPGSRVAFTYVGAEEDGRPDVGRWTRLVLWLLEAGGEPWLWCLRPDDLPVFLADVGWCPAPETTRGGRRRGVEYLAVAFKSAGGRSGPSTPADQGLPGGSVGGGT